MVNRILIGDFGGGDYRMRGSIPGADVTTALAPEQLAFDSSWPDTGVILFKGSLVIGTGTVTTFTFPSALPQVPFVLLHRLESTNEFWMGTTQSNGPNSFQWMPEVTTTYLRLRGWNPSSGGLPGKTIAYTILRGPY